MDDTSVLENRAAYAQLDRMFRSAGLASSAQHLNWGFAKPDHGPEADPMARNDHERLVAELVGPEPLTGARILDVGCGRGGALAYLTRRNRPLSATGVDLCPENLCAARAAVADPSVRFQLADACSLPQANESQSIVLNLESSGAYPDLAGFFHEVARVLKPGGVFCFGDIVPAAVTGALERVLAACGFTLISKRDVTEDVLASRRQSPAIVELLREQDPQWMNRYAEMFAAPGSSIWLAMEAGALCYTLSRWRKTAAPDTSDPADLRQLSERSRHFHDCIARRPSAAPTGPWFVEGAPDPNAAVNVLAFPYAVGGASIYRGWAQHLPDDWSFAAVQLPGRECRITEAPLTRIEQVAAALRPQLQAVLHRPLVLLGWSLGAKMAFELARQLELECNVAPALLVAGACPSPVRPIERPPGSPSAYLERLKGTPPEVLGKAEMMSTLQPIIEADLAMATHYARTDKTAAPIMIFTASGDEVVTADDVLGWERLTSAAFHHRAVPGDHFAVRKQSSEICTAIVDALGRIGRTTTTSHDADLRRWAPDWDLVAAGADPILLACHHAGGTSRAFAALPNRIAGFQICPLELPGRASRIHEPLITDLEWLIDDMVHALSPIFDTGRPIALLGQSLGALVAYRLAGRMAAIGEPALGLIACARRAPSTPTPQPYRHLMNNDALRAELVRLGGTDQSALDHPELMEMILPILRADFALTELYVDRAEHRLAIPLLAMRGTEDPEVCATDIAGWASATQTAAKVVERPGAHFFLTESSPHHSADGGPVAEIASFLKSVCPQAAETEDPA